MAVPSISERDTDTAGRWSPDVWQSPGFPGPAQRRESGLGSADPAQGHYGCPLHFRFPVYLSPRQHAPLGERFRGFHDTQSPRKAIF